MEITTFNQKAKLFFIFLSIICIFPYSKTENFNSQNDISDHIKSLNNLEKEVLNNTLEELLQFKNKFFSSRKCKY